jgi:hypothetical protein
MHCNTHCSRLKPQRSGNHNMSGLSTPAYPNDAPIHGLTDIPLRLLPTDIGCGTPAPRSRPHTATHAARDTNLGSGNHDMSRLSALAYPNDSPIHGLTDIPLRLLPTDIGCGTLAPRSRRGTATHAARDSNLNAVATTTCLGYLHSHTRTIRPSTASPIYLYACFQRILGVAPSTLALDKTRQHALLATQISTVVTTTCLDYLHSHT